MCQHKANRFCVGHPGSHIDVMFHAVLFADLFAFHTHTHTHTHTRSRYFGYELMGHTMQTVAHLLAAKLDLHLPLLELAFNRSLNGDLRPHKHVLPDFSTILRV